MNKMTILLGFCIVFVSCAKSIPKSNKKYEYIGRKGTRKSNLPSFSSLELKNLKSNENSSFQWHHDDYQFNSNFGVSSTLAYQFYNLKQKKEIIVAVIDSGFDLTHEDLVDSWWVNEDEVPGNGIDDDLNGYVDDIHGWNFLGGAGGTHLVESNFEETRIYRRLREKRERDGDLNQRDFDLFMKVKEIVETSMSEKKSKLALIESDNEKLAENLRLLKIFTGVSSFESRAEIVATQVENELAQEAKKVLLEIWDRYDGFFGINDEVADLVFYTTYGHNIDFDPRPSIIGDDPNDFSDRTYGNGDVTGLSLSHGTHVAGTIAANRKNDIGLSGIAANVKIMALKAIPEGDEYDKDIALAIRYAVDNGANIINMSFGKAFSYDKDKVDEALQYASLNDVLIVHAAGNEGLNIDGGEASFPNAYKENGFGVLEENKILNWIEVGASSKKVGFELVADFSNFGNESVTLLAPGKDIYSTVPGNRYEAWDGTSMAAPIVSGVAAVLMSEYPALKASEVTSIIKNSVSKVDKNLDVLKPNDEVFIPFRHLTQTDGIVNLYRAVNLIRNGKLD